MTKALTSYGWPRLMKLGTAAAYLDMTTGRFLTEVASGALPVSQLIGGGERWDRHAIDAALDGNACNGDWRKDQPGLNGSLDAGLKPFKRGGRPG
jgi:hypothetical protein